jgi:hypothetical protein
MNNDLKQQDCSYSGDPMFDDILKDLLSKTSNETIVVGLEEKAPLPPPRLSTPSALKLPQYSK